MGECVKCRQYERVAALTRVVPPFKVAEALDLSQGGNSWGPFAKGSLVRIQNGKANAYWLVGDKNDCRSGRSYRCAYCRLG